MNKIHTTKLFELQCLSLKQLLLATKDIWDVLDHLEEFIKEKKALEIEGNEIGGRAIIEEGSVDLLEGVHIEGPVFIGKGSVIRKGAVLRGPVVIGENCTVGHNSEVVRSLILDDAKIPHLNYVGDSIVGQRVNMGAGSVCANVRLDKGEISLFGELPTNRNKLGAIIGDGASIGCNAVLNPGSVVAPNSFVKPCQNVGGWIE